MNMESGASQMRDPAPPSTIMEGIVRAARIAPGRTAIVDGWSQAKISYEELVRASRALANRLDVAGTRVLVTCSPSAGLVVAVLAIWQAGGTAVMANPLATVNELAPFRAVVSETEIDVVDVANLLRSSIDQPQLTPIDRESAALILGTSGTSGHPKLVPLTHSHLAASAAQVQHVLPITENDRVLTALPAFHVAGLNLAMLQPLAAGATLILMDRFRPDEFLAAAKKHNVTRANLVPRMVDMLIASDDGDTSLAGMTISCGGSALRDAAAEEFARRYGVSLLTGYGLTETASLTHHSDIQSPGRDGKVGRLLPGTRLRVVVPGLEVDAAPGDPGEIWLTGPQVTRGYLGEEPFPDRWLRTGDLGTVDDAGVLRIVGRQSELIDYNSHMISPTELEAVLLAHPMVLEAVVVGWPEESAGQIPVAAIVGRVGLDAEAVLDHVRKRVSPHKRLRGLAVIDEIPRTSSGKPVRRAVLENLAQVRWHLDERPPERNVPPT